MPVDKQAQPSTSGGFNVGNVWGDLTLSPSGDLVGGDKITNITISVDAVTQRPLVTISPYRGLDRFENRDRNLFFGRDQLIKSLLTDLSASNVLLVSGASGSGKSSVVRAGLLPALSDLMGSRFRSFTLVPDENPFESLRSSLQSAGFSQSQTRDLVDVQPGTPSRLIRALQPAGDPWLVFIDQFEEIFTRSEEPLCKSFIAALLEIAQDTASSTKLVLAMRADFLDRFSPFPQFAKLIQKNITLVANMHENELRLAIEQPAARHGVVFEGGLVEEIIKEVQGQPGSLPLLQYTLNLLWEEERKSGGLDDKHLNKQIYRQLGGVRGALQKRADEIYALFGDDADPKSDSARQKVVRQIFLRVVDLAGQGADEKVWRPVRRRIPKATFSRAQEQEILQALINEKLLVSNREGKEPTVEVAHETLFTSWERLKKWIDGGKQVIFAWNRLADDARVWHRLRIEDDTGAKEELLKGTRLEQALEMRARGDFDTLFGGLSETDTQFLDASAADRDSRKQEKEERQQRELTQARDLATEQKKRADDQAKAAARQRWLTMAMVLVSLVAVVAAVFFFFSRSAAKNAASDAIAAKKKTSEAASRGNVSLARYSREGGKNAQALAQLAQALRLSPENREAHGFTTILLTQPSWNVPLTGSMRHKGAVVSAKFSPDGQRVVTASHDKTARLWNAANGKAIGQSMTHKGAVRSADFSPDGQRVVTASWDKTARLWDAVNGKPIGRPMKHEGFVYSAQFSPDGQRVVTASLDGTAQLWDAVSGKPIGEPMKHTSWVNSAEFSPDGRRVVTGSGDKTARLWDAVSGQPIGEPMKHESAVRSAQFSPDGQWVVTASENKTAQVWDAVSGKPIGQSMKHESTVYSAQFSPDGQRVVTASDDWTARLWDAASGKPLGEPMKHEDRVLLAQFSPDSLRVVTASEDKMARLWDAASGKPLGEPIKHEKSVQSAQFSPDGQRVVTASWDKTARLWGATNDHPIDEPMNHEAVVKSAQFSPDRQRVVTASDDKTAQLWDAVSGKPVGPPMTHKESVRSAQFSPNGQWVVTASHDGTARLWDAASSKLLGEPMEHEDMVFSAQFSPDGRRVVTASMDKTARLWNAASGKPLGEPMEHEDAVLSAQFSPDGQRVVTGSGDQTARLWNAVNGQPIGEPMKHEDLVWSAQFSPDGQRVVTASGDKTARLWDAASGKPRGQPMTHEDAVLSAQFSPDGQRVVTGSQDKTARLWNAVNGQPIGEPMKHESTVNSARFSPDGQRVVTASRDKTARTWDAVSGQPLGEPMKHEGSVNSAQFSPDGQRVVTASSDKTARLWDAAIMTGEDTREDILLLAELAEATGGVTLETVRQAETLKLLTPEQVIASREKIAAKFLGLSSKLTPLQRIMKWSVADRRSRTISPFLQFTVSEWLENRIKEETVEGLREALQVNPANARLTAHLGRRLADHGLKQGVDPDEARRARREADFLTNRALKVAPGNDEIKNLRDEVVKLLGLKTH
jgi:WD40 repeat protein